MPKSLMQKLPGECCWPVGRGARHLFCCEPIATGSYCAAHHAASRRATTAYEPKQEQSIADYFGGGKPRPPGADGPGVPRDVVSVMGSRLNARGGR